MSSQEDISRSHIQRNTNTQDNGAMDAKEIRAANLRALIEKHGTIAKLSELVDTAPAYISQILSAKSRATVGDVLARKVETRLQLPHGWMDREHVEPAAEPSTEAKPIHQANETTATYNAIPKDLGPLIIAAKEAYLRGSLKPNTIDNLVQLINSLAVVPPDTAQMDIDNPTTKESIAALRRLPKGS